MSHPPAAAPRLLASAIAGQFLFGIVLALLGTLFGLPAFTGALALDVPRQSWLLLTFFTGQLVFTAVAGRIVDRFGSLRVLAAGAALLAIALGLFAWAETLAVALAAAVVMSMGGASVNASSNVLVSTLYGVKRAPMLNVLGLFGALGAFLVPFVFAGVRSMADVRGRLAALAVLGAVSGIAQLLQREPPRGGTVPRPRASTRALLGDKWVLALTVLLILDFGNEAVAAGWIATYTLGVLPGAPGTVMVGVYWGALMAGRLLSPFVLARMAKIPFLVLASTLVTVGFVAISAAPTAWTLGVAVMLTGLAVAPVAPTIIAVGGDRYERNTGAVFGVMLSLGQLGGVILPYTVGAVAQATTFRQAMLVPAVSSLVTTVLIVLLWRRTRPPRPRAQEETG
jgi:MFS transporter, FHS family, glucose/mannose:H+ symporter